MSAINYYKETLRVLADLHVSHPTFSMGRHLSTALSDYGDVWGMTNKEMLYALQKYQAEIDMNSVQTRTHEQFVDRVIRDAQNLDTLLKEEDPEDNI